MLHVGPLHTVVPPLLVPLLLLLPLVLVPLLLPLLLLLMVMMPCRTRPNPFCYSGYRLWRHCESDTQHRSQVEGT